MHRAIHSLVLALALAGTVAPAFARPVVPAEKRFESYGGELPACDNSDVLDRITSNFGQAESEYWNSNLQIVSYDNVKITALRPWGLDHIPRNFCTARALLSNKTWHQVSYSVAEDQGFIGVDFGVEFCVAGLDREFAYAPACKMEQP